MISRTDRSITGVWWWTVDRLLLAAAILLAVLGVFLVLAASPPVAMTINVDPQHFVNRHAIFLTFAILLMLGTSLLSHRMIRILGLLGLAATIVLIAVAILIGPEVKGATRWIPLGPIKLQPSEFAKPCFAVVSAWLLSLWREEQNFPGWVISIGCLGVLAGLLVLQPDIGMTFVIVLTWALQIFLAGMPLALVLGLSFVIAPAVAVTAYFTLPHVQDRVTKYLEGGNMQADNAMRSFPMAGFLVSAPAMVKLNTSSPMPIRISFLRLQVKNLASSPASF